MLRSHIAFIFLLIFPLIAQAEEGIIVTGKGTMSVKPDVAFTVASIVSQDVDAKKAYSLNVLTSEKVFNSLENVGVYPVDKKPSSRSKVIGYIKTSNFNVSPKYESRIIDGVRQNVFVGYVVRNNINIKVIDINKIAIILDALTRSGVNGIGGITFDLDDKEVIKNEARRLAMKNAVHKAEIYASAASASTARPFCRVGRIILIKEGSIDYRPIALNDQAFRGASAPEELPIAIGDIDISVVINVKFAIDSN